MARYIDADRLINEFSGNGGVFTYGPKVVMAIVSRINLQPTADVVEIETLRSWLYSIAINNVGCDVKMNLSETCEDIISRLDGLRNFAKEGGDQ